MPCMTLSSHGDFVCFRPGLQPPRRRPWRHLATCPLLRLCQPPPCRGPVLAYRQACTVAFLRTIPADQDHTQYHIDRLGTPDLDSISSKSFTPFQFSHECCFSLHRRWYTNEVMIVPWLFFLINVMSLPAVAHKVLISDDTTE